MLMMLIVDDYTRLDGARKSRKMSKSDAGYFHTSCHPLAVWWIAKITTIAIAYRIVHANNETQ